jgi:uncharacterized protein YodC (DUF2158 family)
MATLFEITPEAQAWIDERPEVIKAMIAKTPPNRLYSLKPHGERVTIYSYAEDGTVTVYISGQYNCHMFDRQVFGINPDDLTECDPETSAVTHPARPAIAGPTTDGK